MLLTKGRTPVLCLGLTLVVLAAYVNHFQNGFHFDDSHAVVANVSIRDLGNIPRFFTDAKLFSPLPAGQVWRPLVSTSLAIDYWLGGGLKPFYFHLSTFVWFVAQLVLMFELFRRIMDLVDAHPSNTWTALAAAACYGLHPANAETVNYIIQRADLFDALGVVASLLWFVAYPEQRRRGWYLIPAIAACLSKPPALIYPLILLAYVYLFEQYGKWRPALRAVLPATLVTAALALLTVAMTPDSYSSGAASTSLYRLTQPWVALHYFKCFFLPNDLSADSGWPYVAGPFSGEALIGYLFVAALAVAAVRTARQPQTRPVAFGIAWFLLALLPTSLTPLADVTNDHRMFFPFVGLALAVFWTLRLALFRGTDRLTSHRIWVNGALVGAAAVLLAAGVGTHDRNEVWRTEETLWRDVSLKSPDNSRGLFRYANVLMSRRDFAGGLPYLERARALNPSDPALEVRLAIAYGGVGREAEAGREFEQAVSLAQNVWEPHFYYARWLHGKGRMAEAEAQLVAALMANRQSFASRYLLMQVYCEQRNWQSLDAVIADTLAIARNDEVARGYTAETARLEPGQAPEPEKLVSAAASAFASGRYDECLSDARQALAIRPNYAEAYYVASGALLARGRNADAIHALRMVLRIQPDHDAAKETLTGVVN